MRSVYVARYVPNTLYYSYANATLTLYHAVIRTNRTKTVSIRPDPSIYCLKYIYDTAFVRQLRYWPTLNVSSKLRSRIQWRLAVLPHFLSVLGRSILQS